jgi:hypothetical protein
MTGARFLHPAPIYARNARGAHGDICNTARVMVKWSYAGPLRVVLGFWRHTPEAHYHHHAVTQVGVVRLFLFRFQEGTCNGQNTRSFYRFG